MYSGVSDIKAFSKEISITGTTMQVPGKIPQKYQTQNHKIRNLNLYTVHKTSNQGDAEKALHEGLLAPEEFKPVATFLTNPVASRLSYLKKAEADANRKRAEKEEEQKKILEMYEKQEKTPKTISK